MMLEIFIFVIFQSLAINGFEQSMGEGMILNFYKKWLQKQKSWIGKPLGLCIQCASSVIGGIIFWPAALYCFGYKPIEWYVWGVDILVLVSLNLFIYKRL